jgi:hypothetical protein
MRSAAAETHSHRHHFFGAIEFIAAHNRVRSGRHEHLPVPQKELCD